MKSERGSLKNAAGLCVNTILLDCEKLSTWVQAKGQEMAHEVNLDSLKELEREVILQVLYRDRTVRSIEEERIR